MLPSSSSIVLPPTVSLTPNTLLNRMEKALPHTPNASEILQVSSFIDIWALLFDGKHDTQARAHAHKKTQKQFTHQEMKGVFLIFLDHCSHEELATEQVWSHESAVLCHPNLIWAELYPVCGLKPQRQSMQEHCFQTKSSVESFTGIKIPDACAICAQHVFLCTIVTNFWNKTKALHCHCTNLLITQLKGKNVKIDHN